MPNLFSRIFGSTRKGPVSQSEREHEDAYQRGKREARTFPLEAFLESDFEPQFVTMVQAEAREAIARHRQALNERRKTLSGEFATAKRMLEAYVDQHDETLDVVTASHAESGEHDKPDTFLTIQQAAAARAHHRRQTLHRKASGEIRLAKEKIERVLQQWDSAHLEFVHEAEALQNRARRRIAAYRTGVMEKHPRKEDLVPLWKGEILPLDITDHGHGPAIPAREIFKAEIASVQQTMELWQGQRRQLGRGHPPETPGEPRGGAGKKEDS